MAEISNITKSVVAKVMLRLFVIPMLRNEIKKVYDSQRANAHSRDVVKRIVIAKMKASPASVTIDNFLKAAGLTYDDVIWLI